jgi:acyl carrier protein
VSTSDDNGRGVPGREELLRGVIELVVKTLGDRRVTIRPDTALFSSVKRFDSFMLVELVLRLEKAFGLCIPDEDLDPDTFSSPRAIAGYLEQRLRPAPRG